MRVAGQSRGGDEHPGEFDALVTSFVASAQDD
jgi:hypothetical protein